MPGRTRQEPHSARSARRVLRNEPGMQPAHKTAAQKAEWAAELAAQLVEEAGRLEVEAVTDGDLTDQDAAHLVASWEWDRRGQPRRDDDGCWTVPPGADQRGDQVIAALVGRPGVVPAGPGRWLWPFEHQGDLYTLLLEVSGRMSWAVEAGVV